MDTDNARPIKIHLLSTTELINNALKKVFPFPLAQFVPLEEEADLIIFDDPNELTTKIDDKKAYAYLQGIILNQKTPSFPINVDIIPISQSVARLTTLINQLREKLVPRAQSLV
jgi:hypothetical protein